LTLPLWSKNKKTVLPRDFSNREWSYRRNGCATISSCIDECEEELVVAQTNFSLCAIVGSSFGPNWRNVIRTSHERPADDSLEFVMALSPDERRDLNEVNDAVSCTATPGGRYDDSLK
jgi:hypothetical protein